MADEQSGKGKGKAPAREGDASRSNETRTSSGSGDGVSNAALSLASALRSSMASSQLGSLMQSASGGKTEFAQGGSGNADLREWLVSDLRAGANASSVGSTTSVPAKPSFRSTSQGASADGAETEHMFREFERGLTLDQSALRAGPTGEDAALQQAWALNTNAGALQAGGWRGTGMDPRTTGSIHSYTELDAPLHASVRKAYAESSTSAGQAQRPSRLGSFPATAAPLAQSDDIFALLDAEEQASTQPNRNIPAMPQDPTSALSSEVLSRFDAAYRAPSPSNSGFSREQAAMHLSLAEAQASEQGRQELAVPRPDNPSAQEGVYAPTAEAALASILEGRPESSDVTETQTHDQERGIAVVRKITRYFGASTYLDDVYGQSPLLRETIEQATQPADDARSEQNRQKAIRRLESLWSHLTNTPPQPESSRGSDWVDSWLRTHT